MCNDHLHVRKGAGDPIEEGRIAIFMHGILRIGGGLVPQDRHFEPIADFIEGPRFRAPAVEAAIDPRTLEAAQAEFADGVLEVLRRLWFIGTTQATPMARPRWRRTCSATNSWAPIARGAENSM